VTRGVDGFTVRLWSGYAIALNHFFQRLKEPKALARAQDDLQRFAPRL